MKRAVWRSQWQSSFPILCFWLTNWEICVDVGIVAKSYNEIEDKENKRLVIFCFFWILLFEQTPNTNIHQEGPQSIKWVKNFWKYCILDINEKSQVEKDSKPPITIVQVYLEAEWEVKLTTCKMVSLAIVSLSKAGLDVFRSVGIGDGDVLELKVKWTKLVVDIKYMPLGWIKWKDDGTVSSTEITRRHSKLLGFQKMLRLLHIKLDEMVSFSAQMELVVV